MDEATARKMARIKAVDAAAVWGLNPATIHRRCNRGAIPGAVKLGKIWYVTAAGMDRLFLPKRNK